MVGLFMRKIIKLTFSLFIVLALLISGCTEKHTDKPADDSNGDVVVIPALFRMDGETGIQPHKDLIELFNKTYEGRYRIDVEWFVGEESNYRERIRLLNATDQLPALFTDVGVLPDFYRLLVENDRLVNITPYLEADREWAAKFPKHVIDTCTEEDGGMYLIPITTPEYLAGVFYNEKIFEKAGIEHFPTTWEEFFNACDAIKAQGYTPLGLHTTGTAWTTMLFATAWMGSSQDGRNFMKLQYPDSYDAPAMRDMLKTVSRLFDYGSEDSIDGDFDDAYRGFIDGNTAMFPNGQWMIAGLYDENLVRPETVEHIRFALFPGNTAVGSVQASGWAIASQYPQEVIEGAVEFVKLRTSVEQKYLRDGMEKIKQKPLLFEFYTVIADTETVIPSYQIKWNSIIQNEVFLIDLPQYLQGEISEDELIERMDQAVIRFNYERNVS